MNVPTRPLRFRLSDPTATSNLVQTLSTLSAGAVGNTKNRTTVVVGGTRTGTATSTVSSAVVGVPPLSLLTVSASQSSEVLQGYTYSEVSVAFTRSSSDPNYGWVNVWVSGYLGDSSLMLVATGVSSPISFLCAATGDTLTVYAQTVSPQGVPQTLASARQTGVTLGGPFPPLALESDLTAEVTRAEAAETVLTTAITTETTRAEAAETVLTTSASTNATAITTETTRATTAEGLLAPKASPTFTGAVVLPTLSPTSALTAGVTGEVAWDGTKFYVCTVGGVAGSATWTAATLSAV
jgi:hypothetical protein